MKMFNRFIAAVELLLVFPAALFMTSLVVRSLQPTQYQPAHAAQRIVDWYSTHLVAGLFVLLIAMPLMAFVIGGATVLINWRRDAELRQAALRTLATVRAHLATLLLAGTTVVAAGILAIVAVHMAMD